MNKLNKIKISFTCDNFLKTDTRSSAGQTFTSWSKSLIFFNCGQSDAIARMASKSFKEMVNTKSFKDGKPEKEFLIKENCYKIS